MNTRGGGRWSRESKLTSAWAGNLTSRVGREHVVYVQDKAKSAGSSRVGGEHRLPVRAAGIGDGRSPRGRGTLRDRRRSRQACEEHRREIPAWAGNTASGAPRRCEPPGDPRVGGEHKTRESITEPYTGRSPRGRGTPGQGRRRADHGREIPAWAGNTQRHQRQR